MVTVATCQTAHRKRRFSFSALMLAPTAVWGTCEGPDNPLEFDFMLPFDHLNDFHSVTNELQLSIDRLVLGAQHAFHEQASSGRRFRWKFEPYETPVSTLNIISSRIIQLRDGLKSLLYQANNFHESMISHFEDWPRLPGHSEMLIETNKKHSSGSEVRTSHTVSSRCFTRVYRSNFCPRADIFTQGATPTHSLGFTHSRSCVIIFNVQISTPFGVASASWQTSLYAGPR